jgi:hypothetical protein
MSSTPGRSHLAWAAAGAAAFAYLWAASFRDGTFIWLLSQQEGGIWLDEAVRVLRGERMYRDFFDFVAPGNVYLIAVALGAFGETSSTVGWLVVGTGAAGAVLVHAVAARILPPPWRAIAVAIFVVYAYYPYSPLNHKWATFVLSLAALALVLDGRSVGRCAAAGVLLAAATFCTQDMGAGAAVGLAIGLALLAPREGTRPLAAFLAGYVPALGAAVAALALAVGPAVAWHDLVVFPARQYHNAVAAFELSLGDAHGAPRTFTIFGLAALGAAFAVRLLLRSRWRESNAEVVLVAFAGLGLVLLSWSRPVEPVGFGGRATPLMLVGLHALEAWLRARHGTAARRGTVVALLFFACTLVPIGAIQVAYSRWLRPLTLADHRAGAVWEAAPADDLLWLEARTAPGDPVFLFPYKGGFAFLGQVRNATAFPAMLDMGFTTAAQMEAAGAQLGRSCPQVGVWDHRRTADPIERSSLGPLYARIRRDYESRGRTGAEVELFARRTPCAPAAAR